ncbi:COBW domain-containing protein [Sarocladium implicatum]|nr:COBW domain-containing protein [Sarocladium implicatum]
MADSRENRAEPFPTVDEEPGFQRPPSSFSRRKSSSTTPNRPGASSSLSGRLRRASQSFNESDPPAGFSAATGNIAASIFSRQKAPADSNGNVAVSPMSTTTAGQEDARATNPRGENKDMSVLANQPTLTSNNSNIPAAAAPYANGYHFPPAKTFGQSTKLGLVAFWNYFTTPLGFLVTIYGLNVVAWGGMLFLLLCNAAPAMCHPSCNHIDSPRRKWIEWDSQILNALFCVTGFGLAPWRIRDLWFLMKYRLRKDQQALRRLAGIHRGWFRLPGSSSLPVDIGPDNISTRQTSDDQATIPYPPEKIPDAPLTGVRAKDSKVWKLDLVIWLMIWNTVFQAVLSGFMWGLNRYDRPSWSTGLFVAIACILAGVGGYIMFREGKSVKSQEGVPVSEKDLRKLESDREQGIYHYNNVKDKDLEAKKAAKEEKKAQKEAKKAEKKGASG